MLTREEQDQVLESVAQLIKHDKMIDSKVRAGIMSPRSGRESKLRKWDDLKDLLKEIG